MLCSGSTVFRVAFAADFLCALQGKLQLCACAEASSVLS